MRALIQRVSRASVSVGNEVISSIGEGMLILLGVEKGDTCEELRWLAAKCASLRIFDDNDAVMNLDVRQSGGGILVVSQFTLLASTRKGNRPSYIRSAGGEEARSMYEEFVCELSRVAEMKVAKGEFGAHMSVSLLNDGPVTIMIDTRHKE